MSILSGTEFITSAVINGEPALQPYAGRIRYVNSVGGINGAAGAGTTGLWKAPYPTIQAAVTEMQLYTVNLGDIIVVLPGHAETISTATASIIARQNIQIIGIGSGVSRPQITLAALAGSTINLTAHDVRLVNMSFIPNLSTGITAVFTPTKTGFTLLGCSVVDTDSTHYAATVIKLGTVDNANDGLAIIGCRIIGKSTSNVTNLAINSNTDSLIMRRNYMAAGINGTNGLVNLASGKVATHVLVEDNNGYRLGAGTTGNFFNGLGGTQTANSGIVRNNNIFTGAGASVTLPYDLTGAGLFNNQECGVVDTQGILLPVATSNA